MEVIRSALRDDVDDTAGRSSEFRKVGIRL
jgi:hypothetical protein